MLKPHRRLSMLPAALAITLASTLAHGEGTVLVDQIGAADGSDINTFSQLHHQIDPISAVWDFAVLEQLPNPQGLPLGRVETVLSGGAGFGGFDAVQGMQLLVFSSVAAADNGNLVGDVMHVDLPGAPQADPDWPFAGSRERIALPGGPWACPAGEYWIAVVPVNEFATNGVTNQVASWLGDDDAWHVNPSGQNGWTQQQLTLNAAIRVVGGACAVPLSESCAADVAGTGDDPDGVVNVNDLLAVIANFGATGDGQFRPVGDCAPMPSGDCTVDVNDLLEVIATFGDDCIERGACCLDLNTCQEQVAEAECLAAGGLWRNVGSTCADCVMGACCFADATCAVVLDTECTDLGDVFHGAGVPCDDVVCIEPFGACCLNNDSCITGTIPECQAFGGVYMGNDTICEPDTCGVVNDTCGAALYAQIGPNAFDTTQAEDSGFGDPDESLCPGTYLNWGESPDVWFRWQAPFDTLLTLSTCDEQSFDTSLVVYAGPNCAALTQVACNGDGGGELGCQTYWSRIENLPVAGGTWLWIRVGGYDGAVGPGTLHLSMDDTQTPGACCIDGACTPDLTPFQCMTQAGVYIGPLACDSVQCPGDVTPCQSSTGADPVAPEEDWIAGTSDSGAGLLRAQSVGVSSMQTITVHGLSLSFNGGWQPCSNPEMTFDVRAWAAGADGMPGNLVYEALDQPATMSLTGTIYPTLVGNFPLVTWTIDVDCPVPAAWLSVQSNSVADDDCLFLWMSSTPEGMGLSLVDEGAGWTQETFGLNYCVEE